MEGRVVFNVCGKRFESDVSVIQAQPDTLLAMLLRHPPAADTSSPLPPPAGGAMTPVSGEIFIQRDPKMFRWILYWYSTGGILVEHDTVGVPKEVWDAEIDYYTLFTKQEAEVVEQKRKLPVIDESHELAALVKKRAMEVNKAIDQARSKREETYKMLLQHMVPRLTTKEDTWTAWEFIQRDSHQKDIFWPAEYPLAFRRLNLEELHEYFAEFVEYARPIGINVRENSYHKNTTGRTYLYNPARCTDVKTAHMDIQIAIRLRNQDDK